MEGGQTRRLYHVTGIIQVLHSNRQIGWNTPPYVVIAQISKQKQEEKRIGAQRLMSESTKITRKIVA